MVVGGGGRVEAVDFAARQRIVLLDQRQRVKIQKSTVKYKMNNCIIQRIIKVAFKENKKYCKCKY